MAQENSESHTAGRRRTVLVVDSNARNLQFFSTLLTKFDYDARMVGTVFEALEAAASSDPVLIFVARHLGDGSDALGFMQALASAVPTSKAPIVVMTARSDPPFERECLSAGALTCLHAPVTFENFYRVIQVAVESIPRMTIRIGTDLPAAVNGARTDERVIEISENGAFLQTTSLYPRDMKLQLWIKLPEGVVAAEATVIYSVRPVDDSKGRCGMGLQFLEITPEHQHRIRLFIRKEMAKDIEGGRQ